MIGKKYDPFVGWTMAESKNYYLTGEYEKAMLYRKEDGAFIAHVGDFYGEPQDGIIDVDEKYCVTVGCGIIVYRLIPPFVNYQYRMITDQWYESGRDSDQIEWIDGIRQVSADEVEIVLEDGSFKRMKIV